MVRGGVAGVALGLAVLLPFLALPGSPARASHPDALWRVVSGLCVPAKRLTGLSTPCLEVDLKRGVAVLPELAKRAHILLTPTRRVAGIESPLLQAPDAPNYWAAAWDARGILERRVGRPLPREDVGLAINSIYGRSQDQLHIHIACVRPDVRDALAAGAAPPPDAGWRAWAAFPGRGYRVLTLAGEALGDRDPFRLLAQADPRAAAKMGWETLAVLGARLPGGAPGFYVLADRASMMRADSAHGEELLDETCGGAGAETAAR